MTPLESAWSQYLYSSLQSLSHFLINLDEQTGNKMKENLITHLGLECYDLIKPMKWRLLTHLQSVLTEKCRFPPFTIFFTTAWGV